MGKLQCLCSKGATHGKSGKGFPSRKRIFFIRLDKKGRLVLPLEIREAIGIETNGKIRISVSNFSSGKVLLELARANDDSVSISYSKNGKYIMKNGGVKL